MSKTYKLYQSGRYCVAVAYSNISRKDSPKARAEKKNHSSAAQQVVNDKNSCRKLAGIVAANFADSKTALFVTPSFDDDHYPQFEKASEYRAYCLKEARNYLERLKYLIKKRGGVIKYAYSVGVGEGGRWHFHALIDGATLEDCATVWNQGDVDAHRLYGETKWITDREWSSKVSNVNPVAIAKYLISNARSRNLGQHPWHASRNCEKAQLVETKTITDGASIEPPDGSEILDRENTATVYSNFQFIEYILPKPKNHRSGHQKQKAARPKRFLTST